MPKKPLEILLLKIIKETLLLEEVNEEKLLYHIRLMTSAVQSEEGKAFIQSNLKRIVIGILKRIAMTGSPGEIQFKDLSDIARSEMPEFISQLEIAAEIDQSADPDLQGIFRKAMSHFVNALLNAIVQELAMWLEYDYRIEPFNGQLIFINNVGEEIDQMGAQHVEVSGLRFAYAPNQKVEFMKKFAQMIMEIAEERFKWFWQAIPSVELVKYDVGDLFADPSDF